MPHTAVARSVSTLLNAGSQEIVRRWLERMTERVTLDDQIIFPGDELLDHVPLLIEGMARALLSLEPVTVDTPVVMKARELGKLRFDQGFSAHQILWEYQLLGSVMLSYLEERERLPEGPSGQKVMRRLHDGLLAVQRATMEEFLDHYERTIHEREDRLRSFNHALSHELRTEIGAVIGAARMLREPFVLQAEDQREKFLSMVLDNAERMEHLVQNLLELSRLDGDSRRHKNVLLTHAAAEAARHLREFADSRGVVVRIAEDLPALEVSAAVVELALTNLIANGIKYHDQDKPAGERYVEIRPGTTDEPGCAVVEVADNGRGIAEEDREHLFDRFFRAETADGVEGTGLGLYLVRTALRNVGGEAWPSFPESGETVFCFSLPARRHGEGRGPDADAGEDAGQPSTVEGGGGSEGQ